MFKPIIEIDFPQVCRDKKTKFGTTMEYILYKVPTYAQIPYQLEFVLQVITTHPDAFYKINIETIEYTRRHLLLVAEDNGVGSMRGEEFWLSDEFWNRVNDLFKKGEI